MASYSVEEHVEAVVEELHQHREQEARVGEGGGGGLGVEEDGRELAAAQVIAEQQAGKDAVEARGERVGEEGVVQGADFLDGSREAQLGEVDAVKDRGEAGGGAVAE